MKLEVEILLGTFILELSRPSSRLRREQRLYLPE